MQTRQSPLRMYSETESPNSSLSDCMCGKTALRTLVVKNDRVYIQAGGGVVADSDPGAGFEESVNKARAMIRALGAAREFEAAARGGQPS